MSHSPELASCIEHTLLAATATPSRVERLCAEALEHGFGGVCVSPRFVGLARQLLDSASGPHAVVPRLVTVVGFPLGTSASATKVFEARLAVEQGADELDMVPSLGALKAGDLGAYEQDVAAVVGVASGRAVKVILECCELDAQETAGACRAAEAAGARFVKTSTGFASGGATVGDVRRLRGLVGDRMGIKASGGIRDRVLARALLEAGADRLGTSASVSLIA